MISPAGPLTRRMSRLLMTAVLVLAGGGCAGRAADPSATGEVTAITALDYYTDTTEHAQWSRRLDDCGRTAGVTVRHRSVPVPAVVPTVLRQGAARTLPDLLMLDNPDVQQIAATGALTPLDRYGIDTGGFFPGISAAGSYRGTVYGLAPTVNTTALFYNKDMLREAGVAVPRTWDQLRTAAAGLTRPGRYGMAVSANATAEGSWQLLPFLWSNGADERRLDSPQAAQALQLWADLVRNRSMSGAVLNWTQADVHDRFVAGRAAMMVNGPWRIAAMNRTEGLHWGVAPLPVRTTGQTLVTPLGGEMWTLPRSGSPARQKKAARVLACLTDDAHMLALARQNFTVPARTRVADRYAAQVPSMAAFVHSARAARSRTGRLGVRWPRAATGIYTAIQSALTGEETPREALRQGQRLATAP
ncbi:extracellular solute-binding protein [Streptomyces sp. NPDC058299]|uniref:extracellular solute-binding protein n=1 Tax=unclassified Streptomyces TaxID=2593676 RepID=UPI0036E19C3A